MSEQPKPLVKPPLRPIVPPKGGSGLVSPNPLKQLPAELVGPASAFFGFYSDSLKGTSGLVARLLWWMAEEGLTVEDAREALKRLMRPEKAGRSDYAGQVLAALAREVDELNKDRRQKERAARQRGDMAKDVATAAPPELVHDLLAKIGTGGG